jgi:hypothetical protein
MAAANGPTRFRPLNTPAPLAVEADARGIPQALLWRGAYRRVTAIVETWRIDDEWWRQEVARRYFVVELEGGRRVTIFRDLLRNAWYAQTYDTPAARRSSR